MVHKIGLLLPSSNTTMEPELYRMAPTDVTIHAARMMLKEVTAEGLERMAEDAAEAAAMLRTAEVDILIYGCTSGSLIKGKEWEARLVGDLSKATGIPAISTGGAVVDAIRALGIKHVGVATPYVDEINRLEKKFLEDCGIEVMAMKGLGIIDNLRISAVDANRVRALAKEVSDDVEGVFISCTNLPSASLIEIMEDELKVPVITSNQASMWAALSALGLKGKKGYGELIRRHL